MTSPQILSRILVALVASGLAFGAATLACLVPSLERAEAAVGGICGCLLGLLALYLVFRDLVQLGGWLVLLAGVWIVTDGVAEVRYSVVFARLLCGFVPGDPATLTRLDQILESVQQSTPDPATVACGIAVICTAILVWRFGPRPARTFLENKAQVHERATKQSERDSQLHKEEREQLTDLIMREQLKSPEHLDHIRRLLTPEDDNDNALPSSSPRKEVRTRVFYVVLIVAGLLLGILLTLFW